MDAYNLTNGEHMTQNSRLNTDIAKKDWGFSGVIMSDWMQFTPLKAAVRIDVPLQPPSPGNR
jgi:beta-glucosidase